MSSTRLESGEHFAHYRIIRLLGRGGMGEVFLAEDTRLARRVALKLLPKQATSDHERLERFTQEARSASALNHPGIITVYEIGEVDGIRFMAVEFVDGVTLRAKMAEEGFGIREALEVATEVATALSVAHDAGIVHRDIKPENIMIRPDGYIKVLDFGLAKLTQPDVPKDEMATSIPGAINTTPGMVMGTAQYMSPEQARGLRVDARSDIFSLGIVMYEMLAKRPPFSGETPSHQIVAIIEREAAPLSRFVPDVPPELVRIIDKTLAKERGDRYQSTKQLAIDLRKLKRALEIDIEIRRLSPPSGYEAGSGDEQISPPGGTRYAGPQWQGAAAGEGQSGGSAGPFASGPFVSPGFGTEAAVATPEAGQPAQASPRRDTTPPARKPYRHYGLWAGAAIILAGLGWGGLRLFRPASDAFKMVSLVPLTDNGKVEDAIISPDGRYVVYSQSERGQQSLNLLQVQTGSTVPIVPPFDGGYKGLTFAWDSDFIFFVKQEASRNVLYRTTLLGGAPTRVLSDIDTAVALGPFRKRFAFIRMDPQTNRGKLVISYISGIPEKVLYTTVLPNYPLTAPAWSQDGKWIALGVQAGNTAGLYNTVLLIPVEKSGPAKEIGGHFDDLTDVTWIPNGRGLLVAAKSGPRARKQIWFIAFPSGAIRRVTNDLNSYSTVRLTADGKTLLTIKDELISSLWVQTPDNPSNAHEITSLGSRYEGFEGMSWTLDNQLVYTGKGNEGTELWMRDTTTGASRQLTSDGASVTQPRVSADGRYIIFGSNRVTRVSHIWSYALDDGSFKQLTSGNGETYSTLSPDGKMLVYVSFDRDGLWTQSLEGGGLSKQLTTEHDEYPVYSPDGKYIAYSFRDESQESKPRFGIRPAAGGPPVKIFDYAVENADQVDWTPDGTGLSYVCHVHGMSQIWVQPLNGEPRQITRFQSNKIYSYAWARNGKQLAMTRGASNVDAVLIKQQQ